MLQINNIRIPALLLALIALSTTSFAAPSARTIEKVLHRPGAKMLMDEEVQQWKNDLSLESQHLSIQAQVSVNGSIVLRGNPSPAQFFNAGKLIRCQPRMIGGGQVMAMRNSCESTAKYIPLSANGKDQPTAVAPGYYLLGFENSMYPGFVEIKAGQQTVINLTPISVPAGGKVKVFRDLNSIVEEFKVYFSTYVLGTSLFSEAEWKFGDLYLKARGTRDGFVPVDYKICEGKTPELTQKAERLCHAWNMGSFMALTEMFEFKADGSFGQYEVHKDQGKAERHWFGRLLVAEQTTSAEASFVNVLPGVYTVEMVDATGKTMRGSTSAGSDTLSADLMKNIGWIPSVSQLKMIGGTAIKQPASIDPQADPNAPNAAALAASDDGEGDTYVDPNATCGTSKLWRTELRSYCTSDATPGCARSSAKVCEPMAPIEMVP